MASSSNNEGTPPGRLANKAFHAASQGTVDDLKKLAKKMDLAVLRDGAGETLLHSAARWGTTKTCRFLVEKCGLDINALSKLGATPMFLAAGATGTKRGVQTLSDLANLGADHSIPDQTDSTPLHNAVRKGYWEAVHLLLSIGAPVDPIGFRGTPLHEAIAKDRCDIAKLLLDHGADKNKLVYNMSSPVGLAVCNRSLKCLKLLIEAGANVNAHGNDSPSPLVYAIEYDLIDHVKLLLEAGADPNIRCEMHHAFPVEIAAHLRRRELVEVLYPCTEPLPSQPDWSVDGIISSMESLNIDPLSTAIDVETIASWKSQGDAAFREEEYFKAITFYDSVLAHGTQVLAYDGLDARIYANKSACHLRMKNGEHALDQAIKCRNVKPHWAKGWYREGAAHYFLKEYRKAANAYQQALDLDPLNAELKQALRNALEAAAQ